MITDKQEIFCKEYIVDFNATQAAIRAGYSKDSARVNASRMLTNANIQNRIRNLVEGRNNRTQITADDVLKNLYQMATLDISDVINDDGTIKAVSQWPKEWRVAVSGIDVSEQTIGDELLSTFIKKIKGVDKVKIWELIGKHVDVKAWEDKISGDFTATLTSVNIVPMDDVKKTFANNELDVDE